MKHFNASIIIIFLIINCHSVVYSQKITTGFHSGVNFSDIHGQDIGGKWSFKPGPVEGVYVRYSFIKTLGVQTGIDFSSVLYEHKTTSSVRYPIPELFLPDYRYYYNEAEIMNFNFVRIPLLINVSIPSAVQFDMRAGIYCSFMQDYTVNISNYYSSAEQDKPAKNDFGYILSSGISFPLSNNFKTSFNISYITGRKSFLEDYNFRHGSSEFALGVAYNFPEKKSKSVISNSDRDSLSNKVTITYKSGINFSWNSCTSDGRNYSLYPGVSIGLSLNIPINNRSFFQTGLTFDRKGYSLKDSSSLFYRYSRSGNKLYDCDTKVQIDYAVIPILLRFPVGKTDHLFINTGPWVGFKLNARNVGVAYNVYSSETSYTLRKNVVYSDLEALIKNYDIGWMGSGCISLPIKKYKLDFTLQYSIGFNDVYNRSVLDDLESGSDKISVIRNRSITFHMGITIPPPEH